MGCCCAKGVPDDWSAGVALPEGFVRLTATSDKALINRQGARDRGPRLRRHQKHGPGAGAVVGARAEGVR